MIERKLFLYLIEIYTYNFVCSTLDRVTKKQKSQSDAVQNFFEKSLKQALINKVLDDL